jgi:hypothetical protein
MRISLKESINRIISIALLSRDKWSLVISFYMFQLRVSECRGISEDDVVEDRM